MGFFDWFRTKDEVTLVETKQLPRVPRYCHPGKKGKSIVCPDCHAVQHVRSFSWDAMVCPHCKEPNQKYNWFLLDKPSRYLLSKNK